MIDKLRVCVVGPGGRMGQRLMRLLQNHERVVVASTLVREGAASLALDAGITASGGSVVETSHPRQAFTEADVVIDFTAPPALRDLLPIAVELGVAYVVASTGLGATDEQAIDAAATRIAVVQAANLSLGVNVMLELVESAAKKLGVAFDVEVSEIHHRHKRDAPSGTALSLTQAVQQGRGAMRVVQARSGVGPARERDELGVAALRGGDVAGEHTVYYFGDNERLEITHRAGNADIFARGAIAAAEWLRGRPAGRYGMRDVLA